MKRLLAFLCMFACFGALAQAATTGISFTIPTSNTDGTPLPASQILGYDVQCSSWTPVGGTAGTCTQFPTLAIAAPSLSGTLTGTIPLAGGKACFQVRTRSTGGTGPWMAAEACKTFSASLPNPPGNVTVAVVIGINMAPVYKLTSAGKRSADPAGFISVSEPCTGNVLFTYRGLSFRRVDYTKVQFWGTVPDANVAAPCKAT